MQEKITKNVSWIGIRDWELRNFHGYEYSTKHGSTYNSYLVTDKKTALIDTVWKPFAEKFVKNLSTVIDLHKIDYVIANHGEIDHSGALPILLEQIPDVPIYCTKNAIKSLTGHYHKNWNFHEVKTGDKLNLGEKELIFIEAPMLHWPDSMFCYLTGENILFSNDAFGQHYANELLYNDLADQCELFQECIKYYANILAPFSPLVKRKIEELNSLSLPINMICPSHGVIWRQDPMQIVNKYMEWADNYQENQITIVYDTMWNSTRRMAEAIEQGIRAANDTINIKMFNSSINDKTEIITEIFKSKAVLIGSPTINKGILSTTAAILELIRGLELKNKGAAAFGAYGWSGEGVKIIEKLLKDAGFQIINDNLAVLWNPNDEAIKRCLSFGKEIAVALD
jgi:anaerobic nitric oxide reductase flavorubredoxin